MKLIVRDDRALDTMLRSLKAADMASGSMTTGQKFVRNIEPGEIVIFNHDGIRGIKDRYNKNPKSICIFRYIYFAKT